MPGRAQNPLHGHALENFNLLTYWSQKSGITYPTLQMTKTCLQRRLLDDNNYVFWMGFGFRNSGCGGLRMGPKLRSGESSHAMFLHGLRGQISRIQPCKGIIARVAKVVLHVELKFLYVQGTICSKMPKTCKRSSARASSRCDRAKDLGRRRRRRLVLNPSLKASLVRGLRLRPGCGRKN